MIATITRPPQSGTLRGEKKGVLGNSGSTLTTGAPAEV
jgi:hypothetical protein